MKYKPLKFRILLCFWTGAWLVLLSGTTCPAYPRLPEKDLIETDCGDNGSTAVLVAYDTVHGSTAEVAAYIGESLCNRGFKAAVRLAENVGDIRAYDAVIIGTAIYKFTWLEGAKNFLRRNRTALGEKKTACFMLGAAMSTDTPETRAAVKKTFMDPVLSEFPEVTPLTLGLFGGEVDFSENSYNLFEWIVLKILGLLLGYTDSADWRNWETIDAFIDEFAEKLDSAENP